MILGGLNLNERDPITVRDHGCSTRPRNAILFHSKNRAGGGRSFDVGLIPYIYWTQKMLSVYLPPRRKILDVDFYAGCQIFCMNLTIFLSITLLLRELESQT